MNRSKVCPLAAGILLVGLVVSGCTTPKTTPVPVTVQPTATVQKALPTAIPNTAQPTPTTQKVSSTPLITITFSAGDKCSLEGPSSITSGVFHVDVVIDSWEHDTYALGVGNLAPDKTTDELTDSLNKHIVPDWLYVIDYKEFAQAGGNSRAYSYYTGSAQGPLIFSCFWMDNPTAGSSEGEGLVFETLGPLPVVEAP